MSESQFDAHMTEHYVYYFEAAISDFGEIIALYISVTRVIKTATDECACKH